MSPRRKRRKAVPDTEPTAVIRKKRRFSTVDITDMCQELFDILKAHKDNHGRVAFSSLTRAPNRRSCPEYYNLITDSIDFSRMQIKLKAGEYDTVDKFSRDIRLLMSNSIKYYSTVEDGKEVISDVMNLQQVYSANLLVLTDEVYNIVTVKDVEEEMRANIAKRIKKENIAVEQIKQESVAAAAGAGEEEEEEEETDAEYDLRYNLIDKLVLRVLQQIVKHKEFDRNVCEHFMELPNRKEFRDYYETIPSPLDLQTIGRNVEDNVYKNFQELAEDIMLIVDNAKLYNKANTKIYRDANAIRKIIDARKFQIDPTYKPKTINSRYKPNHAEYLKKKFDRDLTEAEISRLFRNLRDGMIDITEETEDEEESDEEDMEDRETRSKSRLSVEGGAGGVIETQEEGISDEELEVDKSSNTINSSMNEGDTRHPNNVYLRLYGHIKHLKDTEGNHLSDMFSKLPTKKELPDYYEEITKPMCLNKVRRKIAEKRYLSFSDCYEDMKLIFVNAKSYNVDDCDIYKNAVILENELNFRYNELIPFEREMSLLRTPSAEGDTLSLDPSPSRKSGEFLRPSTATQGLIQASEEALKKKLLQLYKGIVDLNQGGRKLCQVIETLPSSIDYPAYYKCIKDPIDLATINQRARAHKYNSLEDFALDVSLLFSNGLLYHTDERSQQYNDLIILRSEFNARLADMPPLDISQRNALLLKSPLKIRQKRTPMVRCLKEYFDGIKNFKLLTGRNMSAAFISLPLRADYPDYYNVIKKPIDIQRIGISLSAGKYHHLDDMLVDFLLMFDNACKYNETDSMIYKDSLKLQHYCIKIRNKLLLMCDTYNAIPNYDELVQTMMDKCLTAVVEATNEYGRHYYDSLHMINSDNLPDDYSSDEAEDISFEQIRYNVDMKRYKRFDRFQTDIYSALDKGKSFDAYTQIYKDMVEMQKRFILRRDDLFLKGERFTTPAQIYNFHLLEDEIEVKQKNDKKKKHDTDVDMDDNEVLEKEDYQRVQSSKFNERTFSIGDYIYVECEKEPKQRIVSIARLWKTDDGKVFFRGTEFMYAKDTNLSKYRRYLFNEVFKSGTSDCLEFDDKVTRCHVMFIKDFLKSKPRDFCNEDVYVCESTYVSDTNTVEDILNWNEPQNSSVFIQNRESNFRAVRKPLEDHKPVDITSDTSEIKNNLTNTTLSNQTTLEDSKLNITDLKVKTFYEQYVLPQGVFKLGDFVSTKSKLEKDTTFYRIDRIWIENDGDPHFEGIGFLFPEKIEHPVNRTFYEKEIIQTSCPTDEIKLPPVNCKQIVRLVSILSLKDYCNQRHTEIPEEHTYICDYRYIPNNVADLKLRKNKPLKKQLLTMRVLEDEIYMFSKPINPLKITSPYLLKLANANDDSPANITNGSTIDYEPTESTKKKVLLVAYIGAEKIKRFMISGYIVFAGETRKQMNKDNADLNFGEISKLVGLQWRSLAKVERNAYDKRAKEILSEYSKRQILKDAGISGDTVTPNSPSQQSVAAVATGHQHVISHPVEQSQVPDPQQHMQAPLAGPANYHYGPSIMMGQQMPPPHPSQMIYPPPPPCEMLVHPPNFVGVPPRCTRNLQSYAYMMYMEGLSNNARYISDWRSTLSATQQTHRPPAKLPSDFLNDKDPQVNERTLSDGLWMLRDHLKNDTFTLARNIPFENL